MQEANDVIFKITDNPCRPNRRDMAHGRLALRPAPDNELMGVSR